MADKPRIYSTNIQKTAASLPVRASTTVESGDAVSKDSNGDVRPLSASDSSFGGFAQNRQDNSSGSAGDLQARVWQRGEIQLAVVGVTDDSDRDSTVYALGPNSFTLSSSSSAIAIGKITKHISGTTCRVYFEATAVRSI